MKNYPVKIYSMQLQQKHIQMLLVTNVIFALDDINSLHAG